MYFKVLTINLLLQKLDFYMAILFKILLTILLITIKKPVTKIDIKI